MVFVFGSFVDAVSVAVRMVATKWGNASIVAAFGLLSFFVPFGNSASAQVSVLVEPSVVHAGETTDVTLSLIADEGTSFDLGGIVWSLVGSGVSLLDFQWENGLDGTMWYSTDELPTPQTAWFGGEGGGPVIADGSPFNVATLTVRADECGDVAIDSEPALVFESTLFEELPEVGGLPVVAMAGLELVSVSATGARYLSAALPESDVSASLMLTSADFPCLNRFVAAEGTLADSPVFLPASEWTNVAIRDIDIVPGSQYTLTADCGVATEPRVVTTPAWGDVNRDNIVDIDDIFCILDGFQGIFSICTQFDVDIADGMPDGVIDIEDIFAVLDAFRGEPYPGSLPCE